MEGHPFSKRVVADSMAHTSREFAADGLILKVSVLRRLFPLTRRSVAGGVLAVLWLFATLPVVRVIEPFELNPIAIETDCIFHMGWDVCIALISWESLLRALYQASLRLFRNLKMHCLCCTCD